MTDPQQTPPPTLARFFLASFMLGIMSVGGGMSAWMLREFVIKRRWIDEKDFLNDFALARVLPGTNVTNVTVLIGFRLLGVLGAAVGWIGLLVGPFFILMVLLHTYEQLKGPTLDALLEGAAAGALGPVIYLAIRSVRHGGSKWYLLLVLVGVTGTAALKYPLLLIVLIALPVSLCLVMFFRPN